MERTCASSAPNAQEMTEHFALVQPRKRWNARQKFYSSHADFLFRNKNSLECLQNVQICIVDNRSYDDIFLISVKPMAIKYLQYRVMCYQKMSSHHQENENMLALTIPLQLGTHNRGGAQTARRFWGTYGRNLLTIIVQHIGRDICLYGPALEKKKQSSVQPLSPVTTPVY